MKTIHAPGNWIAWLVLVAALAMGGQTIYAQHQQSEQAKDRAEAVQCISTWARDFAAALDARTSRSSATTAARDRMDAAAADVFDKTSAVLAPDATPADLAALNAALDKHRKAYAAVSKAVKDQGKASAENPYPEPPDKCIK